MPIPTPPRTAHSLFPTLTTQQIDACRTSQWQNLFPEIVFPATIIDLASLGEHDLFFKWLDSDSIFIPQDEDTALATEEATVEEFNDDGDSDDSSNAPVYRLPKLNAEIRATIAKYSTGVFPKLNWTAPKDAAFILPQTSHGPLHCTSPADVYLLLKSSDFVSHSIDPCRAYADGNDIGLQDSAQSEEEVGAERRAIKVELVLKAFTQVNPSREVRCFVRDNILLGVTQRDANFYNHLQKEETQTKICETVRAFWEDEIRGLHPDLGDDYVFDLYLTDNFEDAILVDFNPYRASTDPLLFSYHDLFHLLTQSLEPPLESDGPDRPRLPVLKVIDSQAHPDATRNAPSYGGNMMPIEMLEMSHGRSLGEFTEAWQDALARGMTE